LGNRIINIKLNRMKRILNIILVAFGVFLLASCADKSIDYTWKDVVTFEKASYSVYQGVESGKIKIPVVYNGNDKNADYKVSFNVLPDGAEAGVNYNLDESDISGTLTLSYNHPTDTIDFNIYNVDGNVSNLDFKVAINKSDDFKIPVDTTTVTVIGHPLWKLLGNWTMSKSLSNSWVYNKYSIFYDLVAGWGEDDVSGIVPISSTNNLDTLTAHNVAWSFLYSLENLPTSCIAIKDNNGIVIGTSIILGEKINVGTAEDPEYFIIGSTTAGINATVADVKTEGTYDLMLSNDLSTLTSADSKEFPVLLDEYGGQLSILIVMCNNGDGSAYSLSK